MRNRFFRMYESIKFKECFYMVHENRAAALCNIFSIVTLLISILSVLVWSISKALPALWAIIIAVAQFAQAFSLKLPWANQLVALKFLLPELSKLSLDIDKNWLAIDIDHYSDEKILKLISLYEGRFTELEHQFTDGIRFSERAHILKKVEQKQREYFYSRYPYTQNSEGADQNHAR